jgi:hypothetical protein
MIVERPSFERRIVASLEADRIPVVLGPCGTGRTSLLLRLERLLGQGRGQYLDFSAAATTPESCLAAILKASRLGAPDAPAPAASARAAFDGLMAYLDGATGPADGPATFLIDEILDIRTFESFPGLRHVQRELITRLAASRTRFVLASRFTTRTHRWLRDAPARFEVVHVPALDAQEVRSLALLFDGGRRDWAERIAAPVAALTAGRAGYVHLVVESLSTMNSAIDPVAALAALFAPAARLTARCRESYEYRLHRARGYGALKAILGILAGHEPQNLTEIAQHLHRTPGSTKDYLSWLEDVDLVTCRSKRYSFEDPLLRLYVRLYGRPVPPTDDEIVREVQAYAQARLSPTPAARPSPEPAVVTFERIADGHARRDTGIVEID